MTRRILSHLRAATPGDWLAAGMFALAFAVCGWGPAIVVAIVVAFR